MIVSASSITTKPYSVRFTVSAPAGDGYGFRIGIVVNGVEVGNLFDVSRAYLEQLESAIRAALIDSETVDMKGLAPVAPPK
jgi:hypothetical protein